MLECVVNSIELLDSNNNIVDRFGQSVQQHHQQQSSNNIIIMASTLALLFIFLQFYYEQNTTEENTYVPKLEGEGKSEK